jgi:hypothetical protein
MKDNYSIIASLHGNLNAPLELLVQSDIFSLNKGKSDSPGKIYT